MIDYDILTEDQIEELIEEIDWTRIPIYLITENIKEKFKDVKLLRFRVFLEDLMQRGKFQNRCMYTDFEGVEREVVNKDNVFFVIDNKVMFSVELEYGKVHEVLLLLNSMLLEFSKELHITDDEIVNFAAAILFEFINTIFFFNEGNLYIDFYKCGDKGKVSLNYTKIIKVIEERFGFDIDAITVSIIKNILKYQFGLEISFIEILLRERKIEVEKFFLTVVHPSSRTPGTW